MFIVYFVFISWLVEAMEVECAVAATAAVTSRRYSNYVHKPADRRRSHCRLTNWMERDKKRRIGKKGCARLHKEKGVTLKNWKDWYLD